KYSSGWGEARKTCARPVGSGQTFSRTRKVLRRSGTNTVTEYEPDRRLAWKKSSGAHATTAWSFEPSGTSTRVTFSRVSDAPGLLGLAEPLLAKLANGQIDHDLGALKELLAVARKPASMAKGW